MAGSTMKEKGSMMNRTVKSAVAVAAIAAMSLGTLAACGSSTSGDDAKGKVYYLNFKPEAADQWAALAKEYTKEKGVDVKVQTAASGTYEQTLKSEIAKTEAPTLFQVNGPVGYQNWKKYTADMSNTDVYKELTNQDVALKDGDKVVGVPYVMETYGLIYNKDILNKYFALDGAKATSMDEIDNFDTLKAVADDMQARKDELGIKARSPPPASTPAPTGDSRPIWPTCRSTMSSRTTTSPSSRPPSRALICRTTRRSSTCTSPTPPPTPPS